MSDTNSPLRDPALMITINKVQGNKDSVELKDCYFYPTTKDGVYLLCSKHDVTLAKECRSGVAFSFHHDGHDWKIPNPAAGSEAFVINDESASGSWKNNDKDNFSMEESGTFTAQATGGVPEDASAASSGAY